MSRSPEYSDAEYRRSVSRSRSPSSRSRSYTPEMRQRQYSRSPSPRRGRVPRYSHSPSPHRGRGPRYSSSPSRSRSRSYSPPPPPRHRGGGHSHRRRRSRSYSPRERPRHRYRSRSPLSNRKRHQGNRFNPKPSKVLGVFGLSLYTGEKDVKDLFDRYGPIEKVQVVYDHQTGRSRGFAFVYFADAEDAMDAKERCNGMEVDGRRIRVDYSITKRPHTPTPGVYMGRPTKASPEREHRSHRRDSGRY